MLMHRAARMSAANPANVGFILSVSVKTVVS